MDANFDNFVIAESNTFAYECAKKFVTSIAKREKNELFNSICIVAGNGCGKTHLLLSIYSEIQKMPQTNVFYASINDITNLMVDMFKAGTQTDFQKLLLSNDVILIDDIHEIWDKPSTGQELYHLLKHALDLGKHVAVTFNPRIMDHFEKNYYNQHIMDIKNSSLNAIITPPDSDLLYRYFCMSTTSSNIKVTEELKKKIYECANIYEVIGLTKACLVSE